MRCAREGICFFTVNVYFISEACFVVFVSRLGFCEGKISFFVLDFEPVGGIGKNLFEIFDQLLSGCVHIINEFFKSH